MNNNDKLKRAIELLEAAKDLIDGCERTQGEMVFYDETCCKGVCLSEDISLLLDEC